MMHYSQTHRDLEQSPVAIRALRSLNQSHVDAVCAAIAACPGDWEVECHNDYDGYLSIVVAGRSNSQDATSLISGRLGQIEFSQVHEDQLQPRGEFETIEQVVTELMCFCLGSGG